MLDIKVFGLTGYEYEVTNHKIQKGEFNMAISKKSYA